MKLKVDRNLRILDFDIETLAAGFADPNWVPQKITCVSWSWVGESKVSSLITGKDGFFSKKLRGARLAPFFEELAKADIVTGHNIVRFDLPVLNSEAILCGLGKLRSFAVQDTMHLPKTKGLKKGLDNLGAMLNVDQEKQAMDWAQWDNAYEEDGWPSVISRCESDVILHKQLREAMIQDDLLAITKTWNP
jgi:hypothetical protein